jgi:hypothetical protein
MWKSVYFNIDLHVGKKNSSYYTVRVTVICTTSIFLWQCLTARTVLERTHIRPLYVHTWIASLLVVVSKNENFAMHGFA